MECPKCDSAMEKVRFEKIEVDRCTNCKELWFDMLEHEHLKAMEKSELELVRWIAPYLLVTGKLVVGEW
jgi:Zn-finger nucleic acid-binding protein